MRAFSGDRFLMAEVARLCAFHKVQSAFETGTFCGDTAQVLALIAGSCITVDIKARWQPSPSANIVCLLGDSPDMIRDIVPTMPRPIFFYLDAHNVADDTCRVREELDEISKLGFFESVIVIHDFKVPDTDWGYDAYAGVALDWAYISKPAQPFLDRGYQVHYNERVEGAQRGVCFLTPGI